MPTPPFYVAVCLFLFVVALLSGCSLLPHEPRVQCSDVRFSGVGAEGVALEVTLMVENPNSFPLTVHGYRYALAVTGVPFSSGSGTGDVSLPARETTRILLPAQIPIANILKLATRKFDPEHVPYHLEAFLEVSAPYVRRTVSVSSSGAFAVPEEYRLDRYLKQLRSFFPAYQ